MKEIDSPAGVSEYLGVPLATLAQWRYFKTGPRYMKIGRLVKYKKVDVDAWLSEQTVETGKEAVNA